MMIVVTSATFISGTILLQSSYPLFCSLFASLLRLLPSGKAISLWATHLPDYDKSDSRGNFPCITWCKHAVSSNGHLPLSPAEYLLVPSSASAPVFLTHRTDMTQNSVNAGPDKKSAVKSPNDGEIPGDLYFISSTFFPIRANTACPKS